MATYQSKCQLYTAFHQQIAVIHDERLALNPAEDVIAHNLCLPHGRATVLGTGRRNDVTSCVDIAEPVVRDLQ